MTADLSAQIEELLDKLPSHPGISDADRRCLIDDHARRMVDAYNLITRLERHGDLGHEQREAAQQLAPLVKALQSVANALEQNSFGIGALGALQKVNLLDDGTNPSAETLPELREDVAALAAHYRKMAQMLTIPVDRGRPANEPERAIGHAAKRAWKDITGKNPTAMKDGVRETPFTKFLDKLFEIYSLRGKPAFVAKAILTAKKNT